MSKNLLWVAGAASLIGYLVFRRKIKIVVKDKIKDWNADFMSKDSGLSKDLTRPAADMILD